MTRFFPVLLFALFSSFLFAQTEFEGVFAIEYKNEKKEISKMDVKVKGKLVYFKFMQGGVPKYDYYILNLETREFYTVSKPDRKIVVKYDIDKLMELYEKNELKDGYRVNSTLAFKSTDKSKEESGIKLTKYVGENDIHKSSLWLSNDGFNFNQFIPVLRLLNCWNEAQLSEGTIYSAEVSNKVSKRESTVTLVMKKQTIAKEIFELPKNYLKKDFSKLMEEEKDNKDLKTVIQTFAGF